MKQREHDLQVSCFKYFRLAYPVYAKNYYSIPNGGQRNIIVASKLKAEGALAGVFDTFLSVPKQGFHGLYIEFKAGKNKLTDLQKEFQVAAEKQGYKTAVVYSFDEFKDIIDSYFLLPLENFKQEESKRHF